MTTTTDVLTVRAERVRPALDRMPTPLLADLRAHPERLQAWRDALDTGLSGGERTAVLWLARRMWPQEDWPYVSATEVVARCDNRLAQAVGECGTALVILDQGDHRIGADRG